MARYRVTRDDMRLDGKLVGEHITVTYLDPDYTEEGNWSDVTAPQSLFQTHGLCLLDDATGNLVVVSTVLSSKESRRRPMYRAILRIPRVSVVDAKIMKED